MMTPEILDGSIAQRLLALGGVLGTGLVSFLLTRLAVHQLKGRTRLGLRSLERLAAPLTLLAMSAAATVALELIDVRARVLSFTAQLVTIFSGFWLASRTIEVLMRTGEHSARLRHQPTARASLTSARKVGQLVVWIAGAITIAVRFGATSQLYLVLGGIGAALAFAARDPIRNIFVFIEFVVDPPFRPGDQVRMQDFRGRGVVLAEGTVLAMSLFNVTIETQEKTRVIVANVKVGELHVENLSAADRSRLELVVPLARKLRTEAVRTVCEELEEELGEHPDVAEDHPIHVWLAGRREGLQLKASVWLKQATSRRETQRKLMLLITDRLESEA